MVKSRDLIVYGICAFSFMFSHLGISYTFMFLKFYHLVMFYVKVQLVGLMDYVCQCKSCGLFCISEMIFLSFVYPFSKLFY